MIRSAQTETRWRVFYLMGVMLVAACPDVPVAVTDTESGTDATGTPTTAAPMTDTPTTSDMPTEPTTTTDTSTSGTMEPTGTTSDTSETDGTTGDGQAGKSVTQTVNGGTVASSANYRMVFTLGQPTQNQGVYMSKNFRIQGGLIGASGETP